MHEKLKAAVERQNAAQKEMDAAADGLAELIGEDDVTPEKRTDAQAKFDQAEEQYKAAKADAEALDHLIVARGQVPRDLPTTPAGIPLAAGSLRVKEEATYRPHVGPHSFFKDLASVQDQRPSAGDARNRLMRNNAEYDDHPFLAKVRDDRRSALDSFQIDGGTMMRAAAPTSSSTAGGEFDPPTWYVDQYAAKLRAGRPFLNALGTKPLPPDTASLNFPKITTGSSVAVQTDGGSVSQTDWVTSSVTAAVQTEAGRVIASYQFIDLGPISDQVIMQDLQFAYDTQIDSDSLNGAVTNAKGLINVTSPNTVTYTDASPTGGEFYTPVAQGASQISGNAFVAPNLIVTRPSVWWNILAGLDADNRPLYTAVGPGMNIAGGGSFQDGNGIVGNIGGVPLCIDANVPTNLGGGTNEARMVVLNRMGFDFWESAPRFRVADQTSIANLQYQFVMYGYYACTSRQSKMISVISGTGLIPVSGF
jgi:HK97 family phage major capsid protein